MKQQVIDRLDALRASLTQVQEHRTAVLEMVNAAGRDIYRAGPTRQAEFVSALGQPAIDAAIVALMQELGLGDIFKARAVGAATFSELQDAARRLLPTNQEVA